MKVMLNDVGDSFRHPVVNTSNCDLRVIEPDLCSDLGEDLSQIIQ
jgi:hypothetical protein